MSQIRPATGRLTLAISAEPIAWNTRRKEMAKRNADGDAKGDPKGEVSLEGGHDLLR